MSGARSMGVWVLAAVAMAAGMLGGCAGSWGTPYREVRHSESAFVDGTGLRVLTGNGAIAVREGPQELVTIRAEIRAETPERLAAAAVTSERLDDGTLAIGVAWPEGKREPNEGCSLEIVLPRASGLELRTTNGSIEVGGMEGEAVLTTSNGSIEVRRHEGPVTAETSNGSIRVIGAAGMVRAETSNGWVEVEEAAAGVDVETSNGAVEVALAERSPGPVRVRTSNGRVDLRLGSGFRGELALRCKGGQLDLEGLRGAEMLAMEAGAARLRLGEGGEASSVQTSNGRVRVRSAGG